MAIEVSLKGKAALVTGARRGIGKAIAITLARGGADVALCDNVLEGDELKAVAREIRKLGRRALVIKADVSKRPQVDRMVRKVADKFGGVDILVNNAGISGIAINTNPDERWHTVLGVNLDGVYNCSTAVADLMIAKKSGCIINIASVDGLQGDIGASIIPRKLRLALAPNAPAFSPHPYNVTKAGVIMLTKMSARQLGPHGIRVNAIAPGAVKTDMINFALNIPDVISQMEEKIPLGRASEPQEIASVALFLASDLASYVNGHVLVADGGLLA